MYSSACLLCSEASGSSAEKKEATVKNIIHAREKAAALAAFLWLTVNYGMVAYAYTINPNASIGDDEFKAMDISRIPSYILGTVFFIVRIAGVIVLIGGIYRMLTARKSGEADEMNGAIIKVVVGFCFITLPTILKALNIISGGT